MGLEILDVFEDGDRRSFRLDDRGESEEEVSLLGAAEAVRPAEAVLFRNPGDRERLARKPRGQNVVIRDIRGLHLPNVPGWLLVEPRLPGPLRVAVPLARKSPRAATTSGA